MQHGKYCTDWCYMPNYYIADTDTYTPTLYSVIPHSSNCSACSNLPDAAG